jgi:hypothetical protein
VFKCFPTLQRTRTSSRNTVVGCIIERYTLVSLRYDLSKLCIAELVGKRSRPVQHPHQLVAAIAIVSALGGVLVAVDHGGIDIEGLSFHLPTAFAD